MVKRPPPDLTGVIFSRFGSKKADCYLSLHPLKISILRHKGQSVALGQRELVSVVKVQAKVLMGPQHGG
jgi:hypothetical protein